MAAMAAIGRLAAPPALLLLLGCSLCCEASPLQDAGDTTPTSPTEPTQPTESTPAPDPTDPPNVVDVQEQIYIITGVFITFIVFLLVVSLGTAYAVIGMRQTLKTLQAAGAGLATAAKSGKGRKQTAKPRPAPPPQPQPQQWENKSFAPDDDDDDEDEGRWGGDELRGRGYDQYPDNGRSEPPRAGRQFSSPSHTSEPHVYDRFHQPMPDAHMPSDRPRRDSHSRYGAGNLARLSKGPAPQPAGYDSRYPDDRERRGRSPGRGQW